MSILVTGATGTIGSLIADRLAAEGAQVKALFRTAGKRVFPKGVTEVVGDLADVASMRKALAGVDTLFLLNAVTPDEVTQAMLTLNLAREAGIERVVYLSVIHADLFTNVPHFSGKFAVEQMIRDLGIPATILRPAYFMQNELTVQNVIAQYGVYPMPIGSAGVAMVDTRDIADVAVIELLRRQRAPQALDTIMIELVGPQVLTPGMITDIWSELSGKSVQYGGDDAAAFEQQMLAYAPGWMAYDLRLMMERIQRHGMRATETTVEQLEQLLGRPLRTYRQLVQELTA
jgi:uncharacterized protein YbjT (DUF2867 family)